MSNIVHVTPFLLVPDLDAALDFFTRVLGFTVPFQMENYAYLALDAVGLRLLAERTATPVTREHARTTVYIDVHDVDALYAELQAQLATLPAEDVHPPADQYYGMRELSVRMPDGHWLTFGQGIRSQRE
jgi:catechol 2,3-dioxygenase-like lactoylglutathione lyase family enzyme